MNIAGIVLAAGRSTRYRDAGGVAASKLVAHLRGEPLVRHVVRAALAAPLHPLVVVTGHAKGEVEASLAGLNITFAHNPDFAAGLAISLRCGLAAVSEWVDGALIMLGDMPLVDAAMLTALVEAAGHAPEADAIVPVWQGARGNPVLLKRPLFTAAAGLSGDEGARRLLRDPSLQVVEVPIENAAVRLDIDDPAGLASAERL